MASQLSILLIALAMLLLLTAHVEAHEISIHENRSVMKTLHQHTLISDGNVPEEDATIFSLWWEYRAAKDGSEKKTDTLKQLSDEMWRRINLDGRVQFIGVILFGPVKGPKILKSFRSPVVNDWQCYKSMIKLFEGECGSINTECGDKAFRALANLCNNKVSLTAAKEAFGAACMVKKM
ncbi:hypothetical protein CsSME_00050227 [Camellia sinensis var. sinensis]